MSSLPPSISKTLSPLPKPCRLLIVDNHPILRHGVRSLLRGIPYILVCGESNDGPETLHAVRELNPDIVLLGVSMPGLDGIDLVKTMLAQQPTVAIAMFSVHDDPLYAMRALHAGARAYIVKRESLDTVLDALCEVMEGGIYLSPQFDRRLAFQAFQGREEALKTLAERLTARELDVVKQYGQAKSTRQVAEMLGLSIKTIDTHRMHIKEKLGFRDAEQFFEFSEEWVAAVEG